MENKVNASYRDLMRSIVLMNEKIKASALDAVVYELPIVTGDRFVPSKIDSERIGGKKALAKALDSYTEMKYRDDQIRGTAFRLPGIVFVDGDVEACIKEVNDEKNNLKKIIRLAAPKKHERLKLCRNLFRRRSMSQIYRKIVFLDGDIRSIGFTWMRRSVGSKRLTAKEACDFIGKQIVEEEGLGNERRVKALNVSLKLASASASDNRFVIVRRRPVPPHPRANVVSDGTLDNIKPKQVKANLPFVTSCSPDSIEISDLQAFGRRERKDRKSSVEPTAIHEGLGMYLVPIRDSDRLSQTC